MKNFRPLLGLGSAIALGGCVVAPPSGPAVMALPSANKTFAQFQQEDASCRQAAGQAIGVAQPAPGSPPPATVPVEVAADMQQHYDVAYTQCMYANGNRVAAPPAPPAYAGDPYYGSYSPYYAGYGVAPFIGVGVGFGGGYWGGGYRGGWGGGEWRGGGGYRGGGFRR